MSVSVVTSSVDSWVNEGASDHNYGDNARLALSNASNNKRMGFLFVPVPFPLGATIVDATLRLYLRGSWSGTRTITAKRVVETWKEGHIKWSNQPDVDASNSAANVVVDGTEGQMIEFDIATMLQDVAQGGKWFGVQLTSSINAIDELYSTDNAVEALSPELEVEWGTGPQPPTNLVPSGGEAISAAKPLLSWRFRDSAEGESQQGESRVQVDNVDTFASPDYDSGWVANVDSAYDLAGTAYGGMTEGQTRFWRVAVRDENGLESEFSDVAEMLRDSMGTLTLVNPPVGATVAETTPPISWTFTGATQESARVILYEINNKGLRVEIWRMPRIVTTDTSVTVPKDLIRSGRTYAVRVLVWDDVSRASTAGDPGYSQVDRGFTYVRSGAPAAVTSLTAVVDGHEVTLTWQRSAQPDYFSIKEDGEERLQRVEPTDVFVSGTTYSMKWWKSIPGVLHTYEVEAVVNNAGVLQQSDGNDTDTATITPYAMWLVDDEDPVNPIAVQMKGRDGVELSIGEAAETFNLVSSRTPVRITMALRGYEGTFTGLLMSAEDRDTFVLLKSLQKPLRLIVADLNIPVLLGETSVVPSPETETRWLVTGEVAQIGDFTFEPGGP